MKFQLALFKISNKDGEYSIESRAKIVNHKTLFSIFLETTYKTIFVETVKYYGAKKLCNTCVLWLCDCVLLNYCIFLAGLIIYLPYGLLCFRYTNFSAYIFKLSLMPGSILALNLTKKSVIIKTSVIIFFIL